MTHTLDHWPIYPVIEGVRYRPTVTFSSGLCTPLSSTVLSLGRLYPPPAGALRYCQSVCPSPACSSTVVHFRTRRVVSVTLIACSIGNSMLGVEPTSQRGHGGRNGNETVADAASDCIR